MRRGRSIGGHDFCSSSASGEHTQLTHGTQELYVHRRRAFPVLETARCHRKSSGLGHWWADPSLSPPCSVALPGTSLVKALHTPLPPVFKQEDWTRCSLRRLLASLSLRCTHNYTLQAENLGYWQGSLAASFSRKLSPTHPEVADVTRTLTQVPVMPVSVIHQTGTGCPQVGAGAPQVRCRPCLEEHTAQGRGQTRT